MPRIRHLIDDVLTREVQEPIQDYLDLNEVELEASIERNQVFATRLVYSLLLLGTCGSGAGLVGGVRLRPRLHPVADPAQRADPRCRRPAGRGGRSGNVHGG